MKLRSNTQFSQAFKSDNFFSALSGSGRCLPDTSSRDSEDAGDGRRAERSEAE